ncbi:C40 family peptidase [Modestobacter sp. Leaf380]|uniref:C40 family peptidase n=1 Tax=Modestobacter sp. Leaf380 TaxID=1736356 RepID=UPI0006F494FE|nr:C40 family peptidase [Modestobacter sp. Leaf380]KQS66973.1 hydrolase [Modestobacter sp. Leaf380]
MTWTTRRSTRVAALAVAAGFAVALVPGTATAAPDTPAEAAAAVAAAAQQVEALGEQVNDAQLAADTQLATAAQADALADAADAAVARLAPRVHAIVTTGYMGGTPSGLEAMLTSTSAEDLVTRLATLEQLTRSTNATVGELTAAQAEAAAARSAADEAAATATAALTAVQAQQAELETQLAGYEADFARLTATAQATVFRTVVGPAVSEDATAAAAEAAPAAAPTEAAAIAVQTALAQVGKPYVVGAAGPDGFDCSGLTQYAYAAAGVSLPHSSRTQSGMGPAVSRGDLQPGDLVFFYSPVSHVGMYIGNGQMVHASVSGRPVAVTSVDKPGYAGARRPTA